MSTYGYFKHDEMSDYAIAHHGILGQKWGVRRYQNEDGSLTEAGKKRYGYGSGLNEKGKKKLDADKFYQWRDNEEKKKKEENLNRAYEEFKNVDTIGDSQSYKEHPERAKRAATLGLLALDGKDADLSKSNIDWFLYEDQTIGYPTIADLVIQGYSKDKINKLMSMSGNLVEAEWDLEEYKKSGVLKRTKYYKPGLWGLNEAVIQGNYDKFLDNCIKMKHKV